MLANQLTLLLDQIKARVDIKPLIAAHVAAKGAMSAESAMLMEELEKIRTENEPVKKTLETAWRTAFMSAYKNGTIKIMNAKSNTVFEDRWNMLFQDNPPQFAFNDVIEGLVNTSFRHLTGKKNKKKPSKLAKDMLDNIAKGDLVLTLGDSQFFTNHADGAVLHFTMTNWVCEFFMQKSKVGKPYFAPPISYPDNFIISTYVNFPTGNIIISDRIDVKGFHDMVSRLWKEHGINHNYALHRLSATIYEISGLGSINIASRSDDPGIVMSQDGNLFCGCEDENFTLKASLIRDIWQTHMIDERTLHDTLVGTGISSQKAQSAIDDWLKKENITTIHIEPGDWTLLFGENPKTLQEFLTRDNINHPQETSIALIAGKLKTDAKNVHHIETSQ